MASGSDPQSHAASVSRRSSYWPILALVTVSIALLTAVTARAFEDDAGTVHEPAIDALADRGVSSRHRMR